MEFGLKAMEPEEYFKQMAARKAITRYLKRAGRMLLNFSR